MQHNLLHVCTCAVYLIFSEYEVTVTIRLIDVNDETPEFIMLPKPYIAAVDPNSEPNTLVDYELIVRDTDTSSQISYTLVTGMHVLIFCWHKPASVHCCLNQ